MFLTMTIDPLKIFDDLADFVLGKAPAGKKRSSKWRSVRKKHVDEHPECFVCRKKRTIQVHHLIPFYLAPSLELDPENLVSLCRRCHLVFGHLGDYSCVNPTCKADIWVWKARFENRAKY